MLAGLPLWTLTPRCNLGLGRGGQTFEPRMTQGAGPVPAVPLLRAVVRRHGRVVLLRELAHVSLLRLPVRRLRVGADRVLTVCCRVGVQASEPAVIFTLRSTLQRCNAAYLTAARAPRVQRFTTPDPAGWESLPIAPCVCVCLCVRVRVCVLFRSGGACGCVTPENAPGLLKNYIRQQILFML